MLADYHMHCKYSDDSDELLENNIKSAIEKGFNEICFTDHVDYGIKIDYDKKSFYYKGAMLLRKYLTFFSKLKNIIRGK